METLSLSVTQPPTLCTCALAMQHTRQVMVKRSARKDMLVHVLNTAANEQERQWEKQETKETKRTAGEREQITV